jgi:hypothetical protein
VNIVLAMRNFLLGIVTHPAYRSDEVGAEKMEEEQAQMEVFKKRMRHRNAIEGTQSELVRDHLPVPGTSDRRNAAGALSWFGKSRATKLFYWSGLPAPRRGRQACNVKRWIRRKAWEIKQAALAAAGEGVTVAAK